MFTTGCKYSNCWSQQECWSDGFSEDLGWSASNDIDSIHWSACWSSRGYWSDWHFFLVR